LLLAPAPDRDAPSRAAPAVVAGAPTDQVAAPPAGRAAAATTSATAASTTATAGVAAAGAAQGAEACRLSVDSSPDGAEVWIDDRVIGQTPLDRAEVPCAGGLLAVEKEGFQISIRTLSFPAGREESLSFELRPKIEGEKKGR